MSNMIKNFDEYKEQNSLNEKRIITKHEIKAAIEDLGIRAFTPELNAELTDAIVKAITSILKKHGYIINV